jgi:hypothetical protein
MNYSSVGTVQVETEGRLAEWHVGMDSVGHVASSMHQAQRQPVQCLKEAKAGSIQCRAQTTVDPTCTACLERALPTMWSMSAAERDDNVKTGATIIRGAFDLVIPSQTVHRLFSRDGL